VVRPQVQGKTPQCLLVPACGIGEDGSFQDDRSAYSPRGSCQQRCVGLPERFRSGSRPRRRGNRIENISVQRDCG